jgi:hypothetical protein
VLDVDPRVVGFTLAFMPGDRSVAYTIQDHDVDNIWVQPIDGPSKGHQLTNFTKDEIYEFRVSPDGTTMGVVHMDVQTDVVLIRESAPTASAQ